MCFGKQPAKGYTSKTSEESENRRRMQVLCLVIEWHASLVLFAAWDCLQALHKLEDGWMNGWKDVYMDRYAGICVCTHWLKSFYLYILEYV